jgi:hypothetical protein
VHAKAYAKAEEETKETKQAGRTEASDEKGEEEQQGGSEESQDNPRRRRRRDCIADRSCRDSGEDHVQD